MPLNDTAIKNTKPGAKPVKLFDGGGLFLHLMPEGWRRWRLKYRFDGKEKLLALGVYWARKWLGFAAPRSDQCRA